MRSAACRGSVAAATSVLAACSELLSDSMLTKRTPWCSATASSMSRGRDRSTSMSGRWAAAVSLAGRSAAVMVKESEPVAETAMSTSASCVQRSVKGTARAFTPASSACCAKFSARSKVRLAMTSSAAPSRPAWVAASEAIAPAPRMSTRWPARSLASMAVSAWSNAKETMEAPAASISVSEWTRFPTWSAACASACRRGPTVPSSVAAW